LRIRKLLIANRGEIAIRIARTCRETGISPSVIYTDADRNAPHTRAGDEAIAIGPSYLDIQKIIDASKRVGAEAIHPGYGFLSENAEFAEACERAGPLFIGPSPDVIRKLGLKSTARELAEAAGVPVVPRDMQFPVIIKASAGGGGRGMRIVRDPTQFQEALESARSEAGRAFGDGTTLVERYVEGARHVEVQIFGDSHGNVIHLFERDCSVQRRHQKIIEESPSPALDDDLRRRMCEAAVALGRAIAYTNAGTVEFLVAPTGEFYFIEVNTRIQVEHPVTELVTGVDLVRMQIDVAEGKPLPLHVRTIGHAIEARLYGEDPVNNFLPSTGTIQIWRPPTQVRVDAAVKEGMDVGIHYDPMLAKIIGYGMDRDTAVRKLIQALRSTRIMGVTTNREYLIQILESDEFREGRATTNFLPAARQPDHSAHLTAALLYLEKTRNKPFPNYRNNPYRPTSIKLRVGMEEVEEHFQEISKDAYHVGKNEVTLTIDNSTRTYDVVLSGDRIFVQSQIGSTDILRLPRHPRSASASQRETANSPMPGQVLRILVKEGQQVKTGDSLVVLEAMKMEQTIRTTINGVVQSILVATGQVVAPGQMLVKISALEDKS
jgi:acyl-CoA carboxylase subunit alpha